MKRVKNTSRQKNFKAEKNTVRLSESSEHLKVIWIFDRIDRDGKFAFDLKRSDFNHKGFLEKIIDYSSMTWGQIRHQTHDGGKSKHHYLCEIIKFSQEAQERINKLRVTEYSDSIFSFAFDNKLRIIGIRDREKFYVIWYDANYEFYPSSK